MGLLTFDEFILTNYCETSSGGFDHVGYIRNWILSVKEDRREMISRSWLPKCTLLVRESQFGLFHDTLEFLNFQYLVPLFLRRLYV